MLTIKLVRGDDKTFSGTVYKNGSALNITGSVITFTAKHNIEDSDDSAVFQIGTASGEITFVSAAAGTIGVTIPASATSGLESREYRLHYDIRIQEATGKIRTLGRGKLIVTPSITQSVT